jgi:hypothetical protein
MNPLPCLLATCEIGTGLQAVGQVVDRFIVALYLEEAERQVKEATYVAGLQLPCALGAAVNLGPPYTRTYADVERPPREIAGLGFTSVAFSNFGMLPAHRLGWVRQVLSAVEGR